MSGMHTQSLLPFRNTRPSCPITVAIAATAGGAALSAFSMSDLSLGAECCADVPCVAWAAALADSAAVRAQVARRAIRMRTSGME